MIILITGCSSGFGYATALYLANRGHKVYASMRNTSKNKLFHKNIKILKLDVTKKDSIKKAMKMDKLDVLINNAGYVLGGFFEDLTEKEFREQFETNFFGVINVIKESLPLLKKSRNAKIINISSVSGLVAPPGMSAYASSKFALEGLSESLRLELQNIKVFLIEPGSYQTDIFGKNLKTGNNSFNKKSPYYNMTTKFSTIAGKGAKKNIKDIPILINKIIQNKKGFRNIVGGGKYYYFQKLLPFWLSEKLINIWMKKENVRPKKYSLQKM